MALPSADRPTPQPTGKLSPLAEMAARRLRGPRAIVSTGDRRLVAIPTTTFKKLQRQAKELSREVGFHVFPMQVAALLIERDTAGW